MRYYLYITEKKKKYGSCVESPIGGIFMSGGIKRGFKSFALRIKDANVEKKVTDLN